MNTSLAPRFGAGTGLVSREDLAKSLNNAAMTMPRVGGDKQFLKLDKGNGDWIYGQEETLVEEDSLWAVNPASFLHGYILWDTNGGGAPKHEFMVPVNRPVPDLASLPEPGMSSPDPKTGKTEPLAYQFQMSVDMVCIKGEDAGVVIQYKQSSVGAMKAFNGLVNAVGGQLEGGKDEIVPIVKMKSDSYKHKNWGRIFNPIFEIVEWRTMDDNSPAEGGTAAETAEEPPAKATRTRTAAPATPTPEEEEAALEKEYAVEAAKPEAATPRRRTRR